MGSAAVKFRQTTLPRQRGEFARLKVVRGPDFGTLYVIVGPKARIGRGEDSDVVLSDLKASRVHAELTRSQAGAWTVTDLGSANGIGFRNQLVRSFQLATGESFTVGETTLEFAAAESGTQVLMAPPKSPLQLQSERAALEGNRARLQAITSFGGGIAPTPAPSAQGGPSGAAKWGRSIVILAIGAAAMILLETPDSGKPAGRKGGAETQGQAGAPQARDLAAYLPSVEVNEDVRKTADMFFRAGFREFRERNFLRAKKNFETVLQIDPGHRLATRYLQNCDIEIKAEVEFHLDRGAKSMKSGKLRDAKGHFETVLRLLYRDQSNPAFSEAMDQLKGVQGLIEKEGV